MTIHARIDRDVEYNTYRFGRSRQRFRGPKPDLSGSYISFIGGSETFGKFVEHPFPALLEESLDFTCANWGTPGAGPSFFLKDPVVLEACSNSKVCVVSVMGAVAMSNRLYSVFKRRNSRVRTMSAGLRAMFPDLNLEDFRFAHNMLRHMHRDNPSNFKVLEIELREAWIARMRELLDEIETSRVLFWMSERTPEEKTSTDARAAFVTHPAFVDREMLEAVAPMADLVVEYVPQTPSQDWASADPKEGLPALPVPGDLMHQQAAQLLAGPLRDILSSQTTTAKRWMLGGT